MRHDIAIVVVTVCRPSLLRAVRSIFNQAHAGPIQVLIGVDRDLHGGLESSRAVLGAECPSHITLTWIDVGYSTSARYGGPHTCFYGGSLRSALTLLADAAIVMYLDDDDWLTPDHCGDILKAIDGKKWAFAYSIYADGETGEGLCADELESVGVDKGYFAKKFGGFVRPSGMAVNKLELSQITHLWSQSVYKGGDGEDRVIFGFLRREPHGCTEKATVFYALDPKDDAHRMRMDFMRKKGVTFASKAKPDSTREPVAE